MYPVTVFVLKNSLSELFRSQKLDLMCGVRYDVYVAAVASFYIVNCDYLRYLWFFFCD